MDKILLTSISLEDLKSLIEEGVKSALENHSVMVKNDGTDQFLGVTEAAEFLRLKVSTVYSKISRGELPFIKRSSRIYFLKSDLIEYIKSGKILPGQQSSESKN